MCRAPSALGGIRKVSAVPGFTKSPCPSLPWSGEGVRLAAEGGNFQTWQVLLWPDGHEQQQTYFSLSTPRTYSTELEWKKQHEFATAEAGEGGPCLGPAGGELGCEIMNWRRLYLKRFSRGDESEPSQEHPWFLGLHYSFQRQWRKEMGICEFGS